MFVSRAFRAVLVVVSASAMAFLSGCSGFGPAAPSSDLTSQQTPIGHIRGQAFGGRTPVTGSEIFLFQTSAAGYGATTAFPVTAASTASTSLLNNNTACSGCTQDLTTGSLTINDYYVSTDANGNFDVGGDYTCTSGTWVYIYARQGVSLSGGSVNPQVGLMALLGQCPSGGTLAGTIGFVYMNEVSTVSMAYALAGFEFDPVHIGTSSTNATGLNNAGANALQMYNLFSQPANGGGSTANSITPPYVSSLTVSGGSGYTVAPTVTIAAPSNGGVTATAVATITSGVPVLSITNPGTGYTTSSPPAVTITGGTYTTASTATATVTTGNGTVPQSTVNSIANILVACINSANTAASTQTACNQLRAYATTDGVKDTAAPAGTAGSSALFLADEPVDTAGAAINIARHPASNVSVLSPIATSGASAVYTPNLATAPNDFHLELVYTGGGMVATGSAVAHPVAVDASGNVWIANVSATGVVSKFAPQGGTFSSTGFSVGNTPTSVAFDPSGNVWVANSGASSISELDGTTGAALNTYTTDISSPYDAVSDGSGNIFVANVGNYDVPRISSAGVTTQAVSSKTYADEGFCGAVLAGATGNYWLGNLAAGTGIDSMSEWTNAAPPVETLAEVKSTYGIRSCAVDSAGNFWGAEGQTYISKLGTQTAVLPTGAYNVELYSGMAFDGADTMWLGDYENGAIEHYSAGTTPANINPNTAFAAYIISGDTFSSSAGPGPTTAVALPDGIAVDASGGVWFYTSTENKSASTYSLPALHVIVGAATPVTVPLSVAAKNSAIAARP